MRFKAKRNIVKVRALAMDLAKVTIGTLIMALGTGRKFDPTQLCVSDLYHTSICPLAKKIRILAKKEGLRNIKVVYSKEEAQAGYFDEELNKVIIGSMIFVPASAGLLLASTVIQDICKDSVIIKKMLKG